MLINKEYTFNNYCFIVGFRQVFRFPKGFRHQKSLRTADLEQPEEVRNSNTAFKFKF